MQQWCALLVWTLLTTMCYSTDPLDLYDYEIASEGQVYEGFVNQDETIGSRVHISKEEDEIIKEGEKEIEFLRIKITKGNVSVPNAFYDVARTDGFAIDMDDYLIVNNSDIFEKYQEIEFFVVLVLRSEGKIISNPLPFVVRRQKLHARMTSDDEGYSTTAAVFAGVLVLVIVVMALLIPFVVRAKRRYRQGKPVFKPGSHPSSSDLDRLDRDRSFSKTSSEPNWYGNTAYNYEEEMEKERKTFTRDILSMSQKESKERGQPEVTLQLTKKTDISHVNTGDEITIMKGDQKRGILKNDSVTVSLNSNNNSN